MAVANVNPAILSYNSSVTQPLSTGNSAVGFGTVASPVNLTFDTVLANINTTGNITVVAATGNSEFTLAHTTAGGNVVYQLTGIAQAVSGTVQDPNNPITTQWINVTAGNIAIGSSAPLGVPNTQLYQNNTSGNVVVAYQITQRQGQTAFNYPDGIQEAQVVIRQVGGFAGA